MTDDPSRDEEHLDEDLNPGDPQQQDPSKSPRDQGGDDGPEGNPEMFVVEDWEPEPDEILFSGPEEVPERRPGFKEEGGRDWAGSELNLEDLIGGDDEMPHVSLNEDSDEVYAIDDPDVAEDAGDASDVDEELIIEELAAIEEDVEKELLVVEDDDGEIKQPAPAEQEPYLDADLFHDPSDEDSSVDDEAFVLEDSFLDNESAADEGLEEAFVLDDSFLDGEPAAEESLGENLEDIFEEAEDDVAPTLVQRFGAATGADEGQYDFGDESPETPFAAEAATAEGADHVGGVDDAGLFDQWSDDGDQSETGTGDADDGDSWSADGETDFDDAGTFESEATDDPIYGEAAEHGGDDEDYDHDEQEPDYSEHDEGYMDGPSWDVDEEAPRRHRRVGMLSGLAALLIVGAGVGTIIYKPELLGMRMPSVAVERAEIARPTLDLAVPAPPDALGGTASPPVTNPVPVLDPPVGDPVPDPVGDPIPDPVPDTSPHQTDPVPPVGDPVVINDPEPPRWEPPVAPPQPAPIDPVDELGQSQVGENLQVGALQSIPDSPDIHPLAASLMTGEGAFAQLHNGNHFVGRVKSLKATTLTLRVAAGEITIPFAVLKQVGTLDSDEFHHLERRSQGMVRLVNNNRLVGAIKRGGSDGRIAVTVNESQIFLPESEIETVELGGSNPASIAVDDTGEDEWIRELIERRLQKEDLERERRGGGKPSTATPPEPSQPPEPR